MNHTLSVLCVLCVLCFFLATRARFHTNVYINPPEIQIISQLKANCIYFFAMADQDSATQFSELFSTQIDKIGGDQIQLRLVEFSSARKGEKPTLKKKFGISRFWRNEALNRWLPSKKGHVYLPLDALPKLIRALKDLEEKIANGDDNECNSCDESNESDGHISRSPVPNGNKPASSNVALKRKRGRPCSRNRVPPTDNAKHGLGAVSSTESRTNTVACQTSAEDQNNHIAVESEAMSEIVR